WSSKFKVQSSKSCVAAEVTSASTDERLLNVAQTCSLLYRRLAVCQAHDNEGAPNIGGVAPHSHPSVIRTHCRLQVCDKAEYNYYKSALRPRPLISAELRQVLECGCPLPLWLYRSISQARGGAS